MACNRVTRLARCISCILIFGVLLVATGPSVIVAKSGGKRSKTVTRTFSNGGAISVAAEGAAFPYPAAIEVSGFKRARIKDVNLRLLGFGHSIPVDYDILLVAPGGRNAIVLSDVGSADPAFNLDLTLDDQAGADLPDSGEIESGTFRPTNLDGFISDVFPSPAPAVSGNVALATFNGMDPNGAWALFVFDDVGPDGGSIAGGWELQITAKAKKKGKRKH